MFDVSFIQVKLIEYVRILNLLFLILLILEHNLALSLNEITNSNSANRKIMH